MKRPTSRQAEAERERRARIISADGEYQAFKELAQAATVMAADPAALPLRLPQTVVEVAAEKNTTLVMPVPVELLRFFDRAALAPSQAEPPDRWRPGHRRLAAARARKTRPHAGKPAGQRRLDRPAQRRPENTSRRLNGTAPVACPSAQARKLSWPTRLCRGGRAQVLSGGQESNRRRLRAGALPATLR
jgi:hypothetical protein